MTSEPGSISHCCVKKGHFKAQNYKSLVCKVLRKCLSAQAKSDMQIEKDMENFLEEALNNIYLFVFVLYFFYSTSQRLSIPYQCCLHQVGALNIIISRFKYFFLLYSFSMSSIFSCGCTSLLTRKHPYR